MYTFETERLQLRRFDKTDEEIYAVVYGDPEVWRGFTPEKTFEEVRDWLVFRQLEGATDDVGFWAVIRNEDSALLGLAALQYYIPWWLVLEDEQDDPFNRVEIELDCALGRAYWDHGYATEACKALIEHAFDTLRLPRLVTAVDADAVRSIALMRRLGFRLSRNVHPTEGKGAPVGVLQNDRIA
jgi:[ribosomal protein S5]-alanine N-acetyltransferase